MEGPQMRKALICLLAAGSIFSSFATDARVISMGKHDAFFLDEVSIFRNPANVSMYPNMVYGSYGQFSEDDTAPTLLDPFFGAIVSYSLNEETEASGQFPMLSIGAIFNRSDEMLGYITKGSDLYLGSKYQPAPLPALGKIDFIIGYALKNGVMIGGGAYIAAQDQETEGDQSESKLYKGNIGVTWPVAKTMDLEMSMGLGMLTAYTPNYEIANKDYFGRIEVRLFSALAGVNGDFVPRARVDMMKIDKTDLVKVDVAAGLGLNLNIDKGFFWSGLEFLYGQKDSDTNESIQRVGGRISLGIERNILKDWFVIRVGCQKSLLVETKGTETKTLEENPSYDETADDLVGLGFGINIENRLKIDFVASELFPYTFSNLISSGQQKYLFNRVSATYSF
jgi:hypothetical protein